MKEQEKEPRAGVFIDLRTDFGFKRCLGDEVTMKSFLNAMLSEDYGIIKSVEFKTVEVAPERKESKGVTFDLRCTTDDGTDILIEMQNYSQRLFKTRSNYYLCQLMNRHVKRGFKWNEDHDIPRLLGIFILAKPLEGIDKLITRTAEFDMDTRTEFWDRMRKYFVSLAHFDDSDPAHMTLKHIWINTIKNIGTMEVIDPHVYEVADEGLLELIEKARVSALTPEEYAQYEAELKIIGDEGSAECYGYDRGKKEGRAEGLAEGEALGIEKGLEQGIQQGLEQGIEQGLEKGKFQDQCQIASRLLQKGFDIAMVLELCPLLTEDEVRALHQS
ncbi:MAG: Rpn family recombination-promoting nuclease/putative transposase [Paludibacteraceae bacterium]|nr:Rpn family recombination-promoting nuclease/putative transposase [Paludibacteraceae bacterium]